MRHYSSRWLWQSPRHCHRWIVCDLLLDWHSVSQQLTDTHYNHTQGSKPLSASSYQSQVHRQEPAVSPSPSKSRPQTPIKTPPSSPAVAVAVAVGSAASAAAANSPVYCSVCKKRFGSEATYRTHESSAKHQNLVLRAKGNSASPHKHTSQVCKQA
jgi:hypothetical protein